MTKDENLSAPLEPTSQSPQNAGVNVKVYLMVLCILAFSVVSYIFNSIESMDGVLPNKRRPEDFFNGIVSDTGAEDTDDDVTNVTVGSLEKEEEDDDDFESTYSDAGKANTNWEPFNVSNPYQDSYCPRAMCLNSPLCTPCDRRHFFILSTARSGSTTLLRMFNALPNMRLSGENHNTLKYIAELTINLLQNRPRILQHPMDKVSGPFMHNAIPKGSMGCIAQQITHNLNPPPLEVQKDKRVGMEEYDAGLILGFKTVRFHESNMTASQAANFLVTHYPCAKYLINYQSNLTHQFESFQRTFNHDDETEIEYNGPSMEVLKGWNEFQEMLHKELDGMSKLIDLDEWSENVEVLNDVVDWLGYSRCKFEGIIHDNKKGYAMDNETDLNVGKHCWFPHA